MTETRRGGVVAWIVTGVAIAATWLVVAGRTVPRAIDGAVGDYGFFTGVADRLRDGAVLYEQIWDNKDPFVFYSIAIARTGGVSGVWLLEALWIVVASIAIHAIARHQGLSRVASVSVAWIATPLVLIGMPYFMGSTHLPGVALVLVAVALVLRRHWVLAGIPIAILVFFKFVMLPLAIAILITAAIATRRGRGLWGSAIGFLSTGIVISLVMLVRGEFGGFLVTQLDNIRYSQSPIVSADMVSPFQKIAQHLVILVNPNILAILIATTLILLVALVARHRASGHGWLAQRPLWWITVVAFAIEGLSIAVTGKWFHHAEILAVSSALAVVLLVQAMTKDLQWRWWATVPVSVVAVFLLMAAPPASNYTDSVRNIGVNWEQANRLDPLSAVLEGRSPTTVTLVGWGNQLPRSGALGEWEFVCRNLAQRPFNQQWMFDETLECLPSAELVVVTNDYAKDPAFPAYSTFVDSVEAMLARDYTCDEVDGFRLCTRN